MATPHLRILLLGLGLSLAVPGHTQEGLEPALRPSSGFRWPEPESRPMFLEKPRPGRGAEGLSAPAIGVLEVGDPLHRMPTIDLTEDAEDLWDRIRRGFAMPDLDTEPVTEQQIFYLNRPGFLKRVFERGRRYLFYIVSELERRGMPTELALLPMVESAYNPMAYSRAHASGLWQFIPSTGRSYNLTQNAWVDERRDVIASTNAALDYLQTIYEMHGDWHLALASYNWGEGSVGRAIQKNQAAGLPGEYAHLSMPNETRNYVPKLQALKNIVAQPELFNFVLPYVPNRPYFVTVEMPASLDLTTAARLADTPLDEFMALNPSYRKPVIPKGSQSLVIPADKEAVFRANLADFNPGAPRWKAYEVAAGERVDAIASRLGLSPQRLRELNSLSAGARLSEGQTLLVPATPELDSPMPRLGPALAPPATDPAPEPTVRHRKAAREPRSTGKSPVRPAVKAATQKTSAALAPRAKAKTSAPRPAVKKPPPPGKGKPAK
ncbi:MAG: transglycosylase SLT domain-containing protein [Zoogloeaceae bacterium]|nr:transglycosylase SLT domain-containing protein [Zoogloeaceae bacterium]